MLRGYYIKGLKMLMLDPYLHFTPVYFSITKLSIRTLLQRWIHYKLIKILNAIVHYICVYINTPFFSQMGIEIRLLSLTRPEYFYSYFVYHFPFIFKCFPKEVYFYKNLNHYSDRTGCLRVCSVKQVLIILTSARLADKYRCKTRSC